MLPVQSYILVPLHFKVCQFLVINAKQSNEYRYVSDRRGGVKLLASIDISIRAPWIMLNEQHIMARTSTK
jgi:hypothetical protein